MKALWKVYLIFILKFALAFWLFSLFRVLFYLFNSSYFPQPQALNFFGGFRFDWMTITLFYLPFFLSLFFFPNSKSKIQGFLFLFSSAIAILSSFLDFEYFKFTQKRTTADLFSTNGLEDDIISLLPSFIKDYWYLLVLAIICYLSVQWLYKKINTLSVERLNLKNYLLFILPVCLLTVVGFRGGIQLKPLNVIQASQYANAQNIPLVLNTPFTLIKSFFKDGIEVQQYYTDDELKKIYSPIQHFKEDSLVEKLNVVLIIAESFSKEYIGALNDYEGYTPFLDSLIEQSVVFPNAFANGKKSIEGLPAILSGIPTLMNTAYISSKYASNKIESLPRFLKSKGYQSAFYHGGENGTMGFNAFTQISGIDRYIGKNEYPNSKDFDGNWGIFDEAFLQFCIQDMNQMQEPFFSGIFTLSSHHPYTIPEQHKGKFKVGTLPIHQSVLYADYALKQFFKTAQKQPWFNNTLFIITADHTQQSDVVSYNNTVGMYRVPLIFYNSKLLSANRNMAVAQQNDIYPSVVDLLGFEADILSFGNSVFKDNEKFSVSYLNGIFQLISQQYCLQFDGEKTIGFFDLTTDPALHKNLLQENSDQQIYFEKKIKAFIQQYQTRITNNQLSFD
ncbi:MAG: sulfatase-like hydrolase/transferase [Flavobacteriales bacterium]|nr:sulfatase-like hydrolase/transferase [Flavobacteriales bacterium]